MRVLIAVLLLLTACASPKWKQNTDTQQFGIDDYECRKETRQYAPHERRSMYYSCMRAKGWTHE
jgi:hypothetical protein